MSFVLDASVALAWVFEDETSPAADAIRQRLKSEAAVVPWIWHIELVNALLIAERRGRITTETVDQQLAWINRLAIEVDVARPNVEQLCRLCRTHQRTAYDAMYLELALRQNISLATLDTGLKQACREAGVTVIG